MSLNSMTVVGQEKKKKKEKVSKRVRKKASPIAGSTIQNETLM